ncbi:MAG: ABC transporter ATP-binding protein [Planctomycetota bacterium]
MSDESIVAEGLTRLFGPLVAVDRLFLRVPRGCFYGFLGPNGAGKSTTLKMLTGLLRPTAGRIRILGLDLATEPVGIKRRIGVVPEDLNLFERLTGAEFLSFSGRMHGLPRKTIRERSEELFALMDLVDKRDELVVDFSHGMKKKLSLAAALIHKPDVLFLDEPFEGVDAVSSHAIKEVLSALVGRQATVFLTSHILEIVERLCTHVGIIHKGRMVAEGPVEELRRGVPIAGQEAVRRTLEEVFLSLVQEPGRVERKLSWIE